MIESSLFPRVAIQSHSFLRLRQSSVEMDISAIHKPMLPGDMSGLARQQEDRDRGDFLRLGHSLAERNLGDDGLEFFFRIRKRAQPLAVERGHYFSRDHCVYPYAIRQQFNGPFSPERQHPSLGGSISFRASLSRHRQPGARIDD